MPTTLSRDSVAQPTANMTQVGITLVLHARVILGLCGATIGIGMSVTSLGNALVVHAIAAGHRRHRLFRLLPTLQLHDTASHGQRLPGRRGAGRPLPRGHSHQPQLRDVPERHRNLATVRPHLCRDLRRRYSAPTQGVTPLVRLARECGEHEGSALAKQRRSRGVE